jgi:glycosyltransferase involved in cell wall biosynthesis
VRVALVSRLPQDFDRPRGGVETVTLALTRALARLADTEVHVVTVERRRRDLRVSSGLGATIHRLPGSRWPQMLDIIAGPGRRRLREYLCRLAPDVVHIHETYGLGIGRLPMPHVFTVHGFDHANLPAEQKALTWARAPLWRRIEAWGLSRQRHIISITPYVRQHIAALTEACIYDIDNPVDPAFFELERREVRGRVFFAGWISHRKNPLNLVRALGEVVARGVDASLHLAGEERDPDYAARVRRTASELGLAQRVSLLGRISPQAIRRELSEAAVFVLPARQENAPMAVSEALAAGVPVISSNVCGMPFMIEEGRTGYLIDPEDPRMLAERLARLLADDGLRARFGQAAREAARQRFHPDSVARKTRAVYEELLAASAAAAS